MSVAERTGTKLDQQIVTKLHLNRILAQAKGDYKFQSPVQVCITDSQGGSATMTNHGADFQINSISESYAEGRVGLPATITMVDNEGRTGVWKINQSGPENLFLRATD